MHGDSVPESLLILDKTAESWHDNRGGMVAVFQRLCSFWIKLQKIGTITGDAWRRRSRGFAHFEPHASFESPVTHQQKRIGFMPIFFVICDQVLISFTYPRHREFKSHSLELLMEFFDILRIVGQVVF